MVSSSVVILIIIAVYGIMMYRGEVRRHAVAMAHLRRGERPPEAVSGPTGLSIVAASVTLAIVLVVGGLLALYSREPGMLALEAVFAGCALFLTLIIVRDSRKIRTTGKGHQ